jgi:hypothetical protein
MSSLTDYDASSQTSAKVLREERSILVAIHDRAETSLEYSLPESFVAEPGELFEYAVNAIHYQNSFPTITNDNNQLEMILFYEGGSASSDTEKTKGRTWIVKLLIDFPTPARMDADMICAHLNNAISQLLQERLAVESNFAGDYDTAREIFSTTYSTYTIEGVGRADIYLSASLGATAPTSMNGFLQVPVFEPSKGRVRMDIFPPQGLPYTDDTSDDSQFNWYYADSITDNLSETQIAAIVPPAGTLTQIFITTDKGSKFPSNLAPQLGFRTNSTYDRPDIGPLVKGTQFWTQRNEGEVNTLGGAFNQWTYTNDVTTKSRMNLVQTHSGVGMKTIVYYSPSPTKLTKSLLQIGSHVAASSQLLIGTPYHIVPGSILLSAPLFSTNPDETILYSVQNRIFYPIGTNSLQSIPLSLYLDSELFDLSQLETPFYVELHIRRYYDPTSDASRSRAPLRADPYIGFRGFHGTDPAHITTGAFRSTHR